MSGNRCLDMAPGNRHWETGVLIPVGKRCRETGVLIPVGNRCRETGVLIPLGNSCRETDVFRHSGNLCHWDLPVQSRRETMVIGINGLKTSVGIQVSG